MKKILSTVLVMALLGGAAFGGYYCYNNYMKSPENAGEAAEGGNGKGAHAFGRNGGADMVLATGVTVAGVSTEEFRTAKLDTELEIETVYVKSGDVVEKGAPILKLTEDCVASAKKELEDALKNASLDYRMEAIDYEEALLSVQYDYDLALLSAKQAEEVYNEAISEADRTLTDALEKVETSKEDIEEYRKRAENFEDYKTNGAGTYENQYDDLKSLFSELCSAWGYDSGKITDGSSSSKTSSTASSNTSSTGAASSAQSGNSGNVSVGGVSIPKEYQKDERYVLLARIKNLIKKIDESFVSKYESAIDSREDAVTLLETELADHAEYEAAYVKAQAQYAIDVLTAKQEYDMSLTKSKQAEADRETAVKKAQDALETAKEALEEAQEDLEDFEEAVGDGTLRTKGVGEILMVNVEAGKELSDNTVLLAFADQGTMTVSVSVGQENIAGLYIGEDAMVQIAEAGNYEGVITEINPVSDSGGRGSITYSVSVSLMGDVSGVSPNQTATVVFWEASDGNEAEGTAAEGAKSGSHNSNKQTAGTVSDGNEISLHNTDAKTAETLSDGNGNSLHNTTERSREVAE